jgi:hypothetical protein
MPELAADAIRQAVSALLAVAPQVAIHRPSLPIMATKFSIQSVRLISLCKDGVVLARSVGEPSWRLVRRKKPEFPLCKWKQRKLGRLAELSCRRHEVRCPPSMRQLQEWMFDSVCETVTGHDVVEPDGVEPGARGSGADFWQ